MQQKDHICFGLLKKEIVETMKKSHPGITPSIEEWKGQEITDFQEELRIRVNATISEKWFYTHMKSTGETLPRIDILNILSRYAGYANWNDFVYRHQAEASEPVRLSARPEVSPSRSNRYFLVVPLAAVAVVAVFFGIYMLFNTRTYLIRFEDADTGEPITGQPVTVTLLHEKESPLNYSAGPGGILRLKTDRSQVRLAVNSPYYHADTVIRILKKFNREETIRLKPDDYALMIRYFSTGNLEGWEKRRSTLEAMIDDGALIFQVFGREPAGGALLYNREEFIDRLTMPAGSLKNIEIIRVHRKGERITLLKFRVKEETK